MGRIPGHYEWDDDTLSPGHKREGGLHQNLFDSEGKLKGSARFVPGDVSEGRPLVVTETVYVPVEQRRLSREDEELAAAISDLLSHLINLGIANAKPVAVRWWRTKASPAIDARRANMMERRSRRRSQKTAPDLHAPAVEPSSQSLSALEEARPPMSKAEAQARYLAALAARAYSDEQMRLVTSARIVDIEDLEELENSLAQLPANQLQRLVEALARDPSQLGEDTLADLASVLGRQDQHPPPDQRKQLR